MSAKINTELVIGKITNLIENEGMRLLEVEVKKSGDKIILGLIIDKKGGVSIDDCEKISLLVDPVLDETEGVAGTYDFLNVSSAGLDRPFKTTEDFIAHIGEKIEVKLYSAVDKQKMITAILEEADEEKISLRKADNQTIEILTSNIQKANIAIEF